MAQSTLGRKSTEIIDSYDGIVIVNALGDLPGGRTLDVSGLDEGTTVIKAGHVIVKNDSTGEFLPLKVTSGAYVTLPESHSYVGVLKYSVSVNDPRAAIITMGQVNGAAAATAVGAPVTSEIKAALPNIQFLYV